MSIEHNLTPFARAVIEPLYTLRLAQSIPKEERETLASTAGVSYEDVIKASIVVETIKLGAYMTLASGLCQLLQ